MRNYIYAGIGSRETPSHVCDLMETIAMRLANRGWILRSGHAKGADRAFENGCNLSTGLKQIFTSKSIISKEAFNIAEQYHPMWENCDMFAKTLHARNSLIILGEDLQTPCNIVLCYAPGGNKYGGTSQGIRIAIAHNIPILNMFNENIYKNLKDVYDRD